MSSAPTPPPLSEEDARVSRTFRLDSFRQGCAGVLETASQTFLLLIAVKEFQAGALDKAAIAAGTSVGLLLSPFVVHWARGLATSPARMAGRLLGLGALASALMALVPQLTVFVFGSVLGLAAMASAVPLITQIYQDNYPASRRGRLYARTQMIRITAAGAFAFLGGLFLTRWPGGWPLLLVLYAGAFLGSARAVGAMPSRPLEGLSSPNPLQGFRHVRTDRVFRQTLLVWMFMGFANLMMAPLRVDYLANPTHGIELDPTDVALLTVVLPNAARLLTTHFWGVLFDRMNFFVMRAALNVGLALGMVAFFTSQDWPGWLLGATVHGIAVAGADVAWSLWVTKVARPEDVADYMGVHTFLTGLRGIAAPVVGFLLIERTSPQTMGLFCAGLIVVATLLLVPEFRRRP